MVPPARYRGGYDDFRTHPSMSVSLIRLSRRGRGPEMTLEADRSANWVDPYDGVEKSHCYAILD